MPPHKKRKILRSFLISTATTFVFGMFLINLVPITVVFPTCAPIWVGLTTLGA